MGTTSRFPIDDHDNDEDLTLPPPSHFSFTRELQETLGKLRPPPPGGAIASSSFTPLSPTEAFDRALTGLARGVWQESPPTFPLIDLLSYLLEAGGRLETVGENQRDLGWLIDQDTTLRWVRLSPGVPPSLKPMEPTQTNRWTWWYELDPRGMSGEVTVSAVWKGQAAPVDAMESRW